MSFVEELRQGLEKTRKNFTERMEDLVGISVDLDEESAAGQGAHCGQQGPCR